LNPDQPFQPPVRFFICATFVAYPNGEFQAGPATGVTASPNPPVINLFINQTQRVFVPPFGPAFGSGVWDAQSVNITGSSSGADFVFNPIPLNGALKSTIYYTPQAFYGPYTYVNDALTADISVSWWNPGPSSSIKDIRWVIYWKTLADIYDTGLFTCNNIPANNSSTPMTVATIRADFFQNENSCDGGLTNFRFTNFYP
ncbi:hypothetical protein EBZ35_08440, partial [bacterium]|nr:hypothetical protein [bacterium]